MKTLFYLLIFAIVVFINLYSPSLRNYEEDISENLKYLKKQQWFLDYLNQENYYDFIIQNKRVRKTIANFKTRKLHRKSYLMKCQNKLHKVLLSEASN